jgi:hypothetical protein
MDMRSVFETFDETTLDRLIQECQEENLHLEFKTVNDPRLKTREIRKTLARVLSAFANSDGGLIVWGLATRSDTGADYASSKQPIEDLLVFYPRLVSLCGDALTPVLNGVDHAKIEIAGGRGYAATFVPPTDLGPHMARLGEDRYYKRSGDQTYRMEHFDLADMFGRRPQPKLRLVTRVKRRSKIKPSRGPVEQKFYVIVGIRNEGRGPARAPFLRLWNTGPYSFSQFGIDGNGNEGLPRLLSVEGEGGRSYGGDANQLIHPETALYVAALSGSIIEDQEAPDIRFSCEIAAEGAGLIRGEYVVPIEQVRTEIEEAD